MVYGLYGIDICEHIFIVVHLVDVWCMVDALALVHDVWDDIIEMFG
jgi:hypothetical protein